MHHIVNGATLMKKLFWLIPLIVLTFWLAGWRAMSLRSAEIPKSVKQQRAADLEVYKLAQTKKSPGPHFLVVPPGAFTSDGAVPDGFRIDADYGYLHGIDLPTNLWAPLYLPRHAVINAVEVGLEDWNSEPGHDVCIYLDRMPLETGEYECCMVEICSYGANDGYVTLVDDTVENPRIEDDYAYQLNIYDLYPDTYIYGLRISYGFSEHLPAVLNDYP
jgi:hypothetical protein